MIQLQFAKRVMRYREGDYSGAFEYFSKAAELGDVGAHGNLSLMYQNGDGVEKGKKKEVYHMEEAAISGYSDARHNLGCVEWENHRFDRAANIGSSPQTLDLICR